MSFDPASGIGFFVVYLAPGFITLEIYSKFALVNRELQYYETIIWSLILSTVIYYPHSLLKGIKTFEGAQADFFVFETIIMMIIWGILLGSALSVINRFFIQKDMIEGSAWDISFNQLPETNASVSVLTDSGVEYLGYMILASMGETEREVVLSNAKRVIRDEDYDIIELKELGGDLLISGDIIQRILFVHEDEEETEEEKNQDA